MVRLVKGAYWDTEIKRAQERGLDGYPVFTRKAMTDLNYIACARQLLALRPRIFPQFATHNALTVATILELAGTRRLRVPAAARHGRRALRAAARGSARSLPAAPMRRSAAIATCSPIWCGGCWRTAPTRRSSPSPPIRSVPIERLLRRPADMIGSPDNARHPKLPLPRDLFSPQRLNSRGVEFGERAALDGLLADVAAAQGSQAAAAPLIDGKTLAGSTRDVVSPIDMATVVGNVIEATREQADRAVVAAKAGFPPGAARRQTSAPPRSSAPPICSSSARARFIALLQREGGKTLDDALSEVREAVDFCRYYAAEGRKLFGSRPAAAGTDRREQCATPARARRLRRDLALEFSAGDLPRAGYRRR